MLLWLPDDDLHVAVVSNGERLNSYRVAEDLVHELLGIEKPVARDLPLPAERLQAIAGAYRIETLGMTLKLFEQDGKPMLQGEGQRAFRLLWQGEHEFRAEFDAAVKVVFAADGRSFEQHQGGGVFRAAREEHDRR